MVDVADASAKEIDPSGRPSGRDSGSYGILGQARVERESYGLSYKECKPGRDAYKAARRAGLSREKASKASSDALKRVKKAKLKQSGVSGGTGGETGSSLANRRLRPLHQDRRAINAPLARAPSGQLRCLTVNQTSRSDRAGAY
jgi:hypothetical protein